MTDSCKCEETLKEIREVKIIVQSLLIQNHSKTNANKEIKPEFEKFFIQKFPTKSKLDVINMEKELHHHEFKINLLERITMSGGLTAKMMCYRIMDLLFSPQALNEMSWNGTDKKEKFVNKTQILNVIGLAIQKVFPQENGAQIVENGIRQRTKNANYKIISDQARAEGLPNPRHSTTKPTFFPSHLNQK